MNTKKLRQKILDLAIRGKLVPQDPNDEPASVLLKRIYAEKERLIKEGKIKRSKKAATADEIEAPFEIPDSWEWVSLGTISNYGETNNVEVAKIPEDAWVLELEDIEKDSAKIIKRITKGERDIKGVRHSFKKGDVLYSKLRTYLNKVIVASENGYCTTEIIPISFYSDIQSTYLNHVLRSQYFLDYTIQCGYGVKMPRLSTSDACKGLVPLPPSSEQRRIVNSIEKWFAVIDVLENNEGDLMKAIDQTKSQILDLAIHGKLVPQDPNDEPAIEILKRINPMFKPLDVENCPFFIPENWEWTTISEIASSILYGVSESAKDSGNYKLLRITDIQNNNVNWETVPFTNYDDKKALSYILQDGDILFARTGATVGKSYLVVGLAQPSIYASYLIRVRTTNMILPTYIKKYFESKYYWEQITMSSVGIGQPNVNGSILAGLSIPIPPYQEQLRIVAKIEELFAVLDSMEESLE